MDYKDLSEPQLRLLLTSRLAESEKKKINKILNNGRVTHKGKYCTIHDNSQIPTDLKYPCFIGDFVNVYKNNGSLEYENLEVIKLYYFDKARNYLYVGLKNPKKAYQPIVRSIKRLK